MLPWRPWVVCCGEGCTLLDGRVAVDPELHKGMWGRIFEGGLTEALEGLLRNRLWIGDDAMDDLLSVDVGGVLDRAAESVFEEARRAMTECLTREAGRRERPSRSASGYANAGRKRRRAH